MAVNNEQPCYLLERSHEMFLLQLTILMQDFALDQVCYARGQRK